MDDMYAVMQRITDIQKRFGLIKTAQNEAAAETVKQTSYDEIQQKAIDKIDNIATENTTSGVETENKKLTVDDINRIAEFYARKNNIPTKLVQSVIQNESSYNPHAISPKGAMGLMQLMPSVVKDMNVKDPFSAEENIEAGVAHLKKMLTRYDYDYKKALAAYNSGPGNVDKFQDIPEIKETKDYVQKVIDSYLANSK
jgi:soluble lytic murein transglycosylase-like protein